MTKESMTFSLQTSIYMDYLSVEDQIVQMFYQQVATKFRFFFVLLEASVA